MASFRDLSRRIGMFSLALFFLIVASSVSIFAVYQSVQESKRDKSLQSKQAGDQASIDQKDQTKPKEGALQGTKLEGFTPSTDPVASLQKIDLVEGTGAEVKAGDTITAHYTGALVKDGTIFQSSHDTGQPFTTQLTSLIKGWQDGIPGMKEGGKRRLVIPAADAYGAAEQPGIPANSDLVFDIELIKVGQ